MWYRGRHFYLLGLVILFTLLTSAVHASGVNISHGNHSHSLSVSSHAFVVDADVDDLHAGLLTASKSSSTLPTLKPSHTKCCPQRVSVTPTITSASMTAFRVRHQASQSLLLAFAVHPRPPTARCHA